MTDRDRPTLPPEPHDTDLSELAPTRSATSSLPGERSTLDLISQRVECLPELLEIQRKLFHEVQRYRYELEQRLSAAERRLTKLEMWREETEGDSE